jgi:hypothetical protein
VAVPLLAVAVNVTGKLVASERLAVSLKADEPLLPSVIFVLAAVKRKLGVLAIRFLLNKG